MLSLSDYTGRRILVTGASGFLGGSLANYLSATNCEIVRLSRPGRVLPPLAGVARTIDSCGDYANRATWERALDGVSTVFHFAAQTSVQVAERDPELDIAANVVPMVLLLDAARRSKSRPTVVFASTATVTGLPGKLPVDDSAPGRPITVYDLHKLMAEQYLHYYVDCGAVLGTSLRLTNVFGPGPRSSSPDRGMLNQMISRAAAGQILTVYGSGKCIRDYIFVTDAIRAFLVAGLEAKLLGPQPFLIGSGAGTAIKDALELVASRASLRTGKKVAVIHTDPPHPLSPIEGRDFIAGTHRFTDASGWRPEVSLAAGIDMTLEVLV